MLIFHNNQLFIIQTSSNISQNSQKESPSFFNFIQEILGIKHLDKTSIYSPQPLAEPINKNIRDRYYGLVEEEVGQKPQAPTETITSFLPSQDSVTGPNNPSIIASPVTILTIMVLGSGAVLLIKRNQILSNFQNEIGFAEKLMERWGLIKQKVSETAVFLHNQELKEAQVLANSAQAIDNEKFSQQEFLLFAKIKYCLAYNIAEYEGLNQSIQRFQSALQTQKGYINIEQIELTCQGSKQKEFYQFIHNFLDSLPDREVFRSQMQHKLSELLVQIKTTEGKHNLQAYGQELYRLADHQFSLQLLLSFKGQNHNFSILKEISEIVDNIGEKEAIDLKSLTCLIMVHYNTFEQLGKIIGVTGKQSHPDTYARMLQYIALNRRHQNSFAKFEQLIAIMRQWYPSYQAIVGIRQEYLADIYRQPQQFTDQIPGLNIYLKYKNSLSDHKTGYTFIDFGEEKEAAVIG